MTIRWGIVNAGKICHDFVNAIDSYPDKGDIMVVATVAAREKSRAQEFAKYHNIPKVFGSYTEMAKSKDIDVAYIGALNPYHYELSKQQLSLSNIARRENLFLMEAVWSRFSPLYASLEKEINSGKLGQVQFVDVNLGHPIADIDRISKKELGGSAILDMGVYALQFAQFIFKRVVGTLGRSTIEDPFHFPNQLTHVNGSVENFRLHSSPKPYNFQNSAGLVYEAIEVARCVRQGLKESPRMTHKDSQILSKLMDTVRKQVGVHLTADDNEFKV